MNKHIYEALKSDEHIRLIVLHPSQDPSAALKCSIQQVELNNNNIHDYESISYT
jgi:hypothetical protein